MLLYFYTSQTKSPKMYTEQTKACLKVTEITEAQIRAENREYNPAEWDRIISRFLKFKQVKFYKAEPQAGYSYARYYATYIIPEGIHLLVSINYHSSLSNAGFARVFILDGMIHRTLLKDVKGNYGYCENDKSNREIMARNSKNFGAIFSTEF